MCVSGIYPPSDPTHVPFDISAGSLRVSFSWRLWKLAGSFAHCLQCSVSVRQSLIQTKTSAPISHAKLAGLMIYEILPVFLKKAMDHDETNGYF